MLSISGRTEPGCDYIYAITRLDHASFAVARSAKRFAIYRVQVSKRPEVLIAAAHLPPKEPGANTDDNMRSVAFDLASRSPEQTKAQAATYSHRGRWRSEHESL